MAERLAPEQIELRVTSEPEVQVRKHHKVRRILAVLVVGLMLVVAAGAIAKVLAVHRSAELIRPTALVPADLPANVLVVLARPGQELPMAGTLAALDDSGVTVSMLTLTRGETQPPDVSSSDTRLASLRGSELRASAQALGVDSVEVGAFADGELLTMDPSAVTRRIGMEITSSAPSVILTVSDVTGHDTDSQAVAAYTIAAAQEAGSGVARVWTVTRGDREVAWNGVVADSIARDVPEPQVSVEIGDQASVKGDAVHAHRTQGPHLVASTYPYADRIPAWAYFRFWDREYYALAWGTPIEE